MQDGMDELNDIPGIGPSRRAALTAAGIVSRVALAEMSVDQLVSLTGMPRKQAEAALQSVHNSAAATAATLPPAPTDETFPTAISPNLPESELLETAEAVAPDEPVLPDEDADPVLGARAHADRASLRVQTALADASRIWDSPRLHRAMARVELIMEDVIAAPAGILRPGTSRRLAARLDTLADWLETTLAAARPLTDKRRDVIRERLRSDREYVEESLKAAANRAKKATAGKKARGKNGKRS